MASGPGRGQGRGNLPQHAGRPARRRVPPRSSPHEQHAGTRPTRRRSDTATWARPRVPGVGRARRHEQRRPVGRRLLTHLASTVTDRVPCVGRARRTPRPTGRRRPMGRTTATAGPARPCDRRRAPPAMRMRPRLDAARDDSCGHLRVDPSPPLHRLSPAAPLRTAPPMDPVPSHLSRLRPCSAMALPRTTVARPPSPLRRTRRSGQHLCVRRDRQPHDRPVRPRRTADGGPGRHRLVHRHQRLPRSRARGRSTSSAFTDPHASTRRSTPTNRGDPRP